MSYHIGLSRGQPHCRHVTCIASILFGSANLIHRDLQLPKQFWTKSHQSHLVNEKSNTPPAKNLNVQSCSPPLSTELPYPNNRYRVSTRKFRIYWCMVIALSVLIEVGCGNPTRCYNTYDVCRQGAKVSYPFSSLKFGMKILERIIVSIS